MRENALRSLKTDEAPRPVSARQRWDTADVRREDRFAYFREGVCQAFLSYTPEKPPHGDVTARVARVALDGAWLGQVDTTPHSAIRTKRDIGHSPDQYLSLGIQLSGGADLTVSGGSRVQRRGDVYLVDPSRITRIDIFEGQNYAATALLIDKSVLSQKAMTSFDDFVTLSNRPFSEAIVGCLSVIARRSMYGTVEELDQLANAAISLLSANLVLGRERVLADCDTAPSAREGMATAIKLFVSQHLADPMLSPAFVAARFGISVRYIHKVFSGDEETFGRMVLTLRLEQIRRELLVPSNVHISVGEIAHRWGFRDLTSFHRNFKHRFHETPGGLRAAFRY